MSLYLTEYRTDQEVIKHKLDHKGRILTPGDGHVFWECVGMYVHACARVKTRQEGSCPQTKKRTLIRTNLSDGIGR